MIQFLNRKTFFFPKNIYQLEGIEKIFSVDQVYQNNAQFHEGRKNWGEIPLLYLIVAMKIH